MHHNYYDHLNNIKLLELYPNQNSQPGFESLNFGYEGPIYSYNSFKLPDFISSIQLLEYSGNEDFSSWIKQTAKTIVEYIKKFINWIINIFKRAINFIKELLFNFLQKSSNKIYCLTPREFDKALKEFNSFLSNTKLRLTAFSETDELIFIHSTVLKNLSYILIDLLKERSIYHTKGFPKTIIQKAIENNYIKYSNKLHPTTWDYLLKNNVFESGRIFSGYEAINFVKPININFNNINETNIKKYSDLINTCINTNISIMEDKYLNVLNGLKRFCDQNYIQIILDNYYYDVQGKTSTEDLNRLKIFTMSIVNIIPNIFIKNINTLVPFYNDVVKEFSKLFKSSDEFIFKIFKNSDHVEKLIKTITPIKTIESINCYKTSDFIAILNKLDPEISIKNYYNSYCITTSLSSNQFILVGDVLINKLTKDELDVVLYHEFGHYKNTHIFKTLEKAIKYIILGLKAPKEIRPIKEEMEADEIAVKYTNLNIVLATLNKLKIIINDQDAKKEINERINHLIKKFK